MKFNLTFFQICINEMYYEYQFDYYRKTVSLDYNKAICVPDGSDLLESIEGVGATSKWTLDKVRHVYTTHFPQVNGKKIYLL